MPGVFLQEFSPERDTLKTARALGGFDPELPTETFDVSPDGARLTVAGKESLVKLMQAERVAGVSRPSE